MKKYLSVLCAVLLSGVFSFSACSAAGAAAPPSLSPPEDAEELFSGNSIDENISSEEGGYSDEHGSFEETDPPADIPEAEPPTENEPPMSELKYIKVVCDGLNVREKPSLSASVKGQLHRGERLFVTGKEKGFYKTYYKNAVVYVSADEKYVAVYQSEGGSEQTEKIIEEGCKLLGTPYVYGAVRYHDGTGRRLSGFTVTKFDCSSLMQYIFYMGAEEILQVNTRTQVYQGTAVARKDLKRGDLIFFTNASRQYNQGIERIGHVGLYLGDNLLLHTASDYCKIEEINATRWGYYVQARRIL